MDNSHTYVLNPTAMAQLRACPRFWSVSLSVQFSAPQLLPVSWGGVVLSVTRDARPRSIKSDLEHGLCASLCFLHCALFSSHFQTVFPTVRRCSMQGMVIFSHREMVPPGRAPFPNALGSRLHSRCLIRILPCYLGWIERVEGVETSVTREKHLGKDDNWMQASAGTIILPTCGLLPPQA